ncbi:MAG: hypothetical protein CVU29_05350 [Betaproteobacteria bacterium HGW-Betaproteobacteria-22]|nr:MAG: hypothetical protein CVU29_05350 [Betaproteobacteria bacterium HGW-Betaproteobacteria-22]
MLVHSQAIKALSPADYLIIEQEHKLLEQYLENLRDACACSKTIQPPDCQQCNHEKQASCQGRLPSFLFHILDLASKHFQHEETIMLNRPHVTEDYEYFRAHRQAHKAIIDQLYVLSDECLALRSKGNTPEIFNQFYHQLIALFEAHDQDFDDPFIKSTTHEQKKD